MRDAHVFPTPFPPKGWRPINHRMIFNPLSCTRQTCTAFVRRRFHSRQSKRRAACLDRHTVHRTCVYCFSVSGGARHFFAGGGQGHNFYPNGAGILDRNQYGLRSWSRISVKHFKFPSHIDQTCWKTLRSLAFLIRNTQEFENEACLKIFMLHWLDRF